MVIFSGTALLTITSAWHTASLSSATAAGLSRGIRMVIFWGAAMLTIASAWHTASLSSATAVGLTAPPGGMGSKSSPADSHGQQAFSFSKDAAKDASCASVSSKSMAEPPRVASLRFRASLAKSVLLVGAIARNQAIAFADCTLHSRTNAACNFNLARKSTAVTV